MTAKEAYEELKHLDNLYSDEEWLCPPRTGDESDGSKLARTFGHDIFILWQAVKTEAQREL